MAKPTTHCGSLTLRKLPTSTFATRSHVAKVDVGFAHCTEHYSSEKLKGVLGSECRTGGRLVGCRQRLEKKKKDFINFLPDEAFLSTKFLVYTTLSPKSLKYVKKW